MGRTYKFVTVVVSFVCQLMLCCSYALADGTPMEQNNFTLTPAVTGARFIADHDLSPLHLYVFQGSGKIGVDLQADYQWGPVEDGYNLVSDEVKIASIVPQTPTIPTNFFPDPTVDFEYTSGEDSASSSFSVNMNKTFSSYAYISMEVHVQAIRTLVTAGESHVEVQETNDAYFYVRISLFNDRYIALSDFAADQVLRVDLANQILTPDSSQSTGALVEYEPINGEKVNIAAQNGKIEFVSNATSTEPYTSYSMAFFPYYAAGNVFANTALSSQAVSPKGSQYKASESSVASDSVQVTVGDSTTTPKYNMSVYYSIVEYADGDVMVKQPLGGSYVQVSKGDRLVPGSIVRMRNSTNSSGAVVKPYFEVKFYNRQKAQVQLLGEYKELDGGLYIKLGETGVESTAPCDMVADATNFVYDVANNTREYARIVIIKGLSNGVEWATSGWGWLASKAAGEAAQYVVEQTTSSSSSKSVGQQYSSEALLDDPITQASSVSMVATIKGDGSVVLENRGRTLKLTDFTGRSSGTRLPERTSVTINGNSGAISAPSALAEASYAPSVPLSISPANGETVNSLYDCISFSYPLAGSIPSRTFLARVNGVLVSDQLFPGFIGSSFVYPISNGSRWCPTQVLPLKEGLNTVSAFLTTQEGVTSTATSEFYAVPALPAAPTGLTPLAGRSTIMLRWQTSREENVSGYNVYRRLDSGTWLKINDELVAQAAYVDAEIPASSSITYSVSAVTQSGREGLASATVQTSLNSSASHVAPSAVESVSAGVISNAVKVEFSPASDGFLWKIKRATAETGPYVDLLPEHEFLSASPYLDSDVTSGSTYWYQIIPYGADLTQGVPKLSSGTMMEDFAPEAPEGVTVTMRRVGAILEWNPSSDSSIVGYKVYRQEADGAFQERTTFSLTDPTYTDIVGPNTDYGWVVKAVNRTGRESEASRIVRSSTWGFPIASSYNIRVISNAGGTVSPIGLLSVQRGATQSFVLTPKSGYRVTNLIVDGYSLGALDNFALSGIVEDHTIEARFAPTRTTISLKPVKIDFGKVKLKKSVTKRFTVKNVSKSAVIISKVTFSGKGSSRFSSSVRGPISLLPNQYTYVNVTFTPTDKATKYIVMTIVPKNSRIKMPSAVVAGSGK